MLEFFAILCELDDLECRQVINEVGNLIVGQLVGASEFQQDLLQSSYVELVLLTVHLLQLQVDASRRVHIGQLSRLGKRGIVFVETATCS